VGDKPELDSNARWKVDRDTSQSPRSEYFPCRLACVRALQDSQTGRRVTRERWDYCLLKISGSVLASEFYLENMCGLSLGQISGFSFLAGQACCSLRILLNELSIQVCLPSNITALMYRRGRVESRNSVAWSRTPFACSIQHFLSRQAIPIRVHNNCHCSRL
jgi:hypothetical protein